MNDNIEAVLRSIDASLRFIGHMLQLIVCGIVAGLIALIMNAATARADEAIPAPVVRNAMFIVEHLLVKDFPKLQGYAMDVDPPPAFFAELDHHAGEFDGATIKIEQRRDILCHAIDLAHEISHHALGLRYGMTPRESEPYARQVDAMLTQERYLPGCRE